MRMNPLIQSARSVAPGLALCALLAGSAACAHDGQRERASVSAVTNREVAGKEEPPNKTRMHYTEISNERALGRDQPADSHLAEGNGMPRDTSAPRTAEVEACELAVYFATNSTALDQGSRDRLDHVADCMKRREVDHATIVGSADPSGSAQHNDQLSLERARVVAEYLRNRGVPDDQINVRGKGEVASTNRQLWPVERNAQVGVTR
jgi:outer membrane protein OmpA-like peptidoglycan-associated protein